VRQRGSGWAPRKAAARPAGRQDVNLSVLKNGRARAIRFSTLARLCRVLDCQPGDLLSYHADQPAKSSG
jgi:putative transcriptional regulator